MAPASTLSYSTSNPTHPCWSESCLPGGLSCGFFRGEVGCACTLPFPAAPSPGPGRLIGRSQSHSTRAVRGSHSPLHMHGYGGRRVKDVLTQTCLDRDCHIICPLVHNAAFTRVSEKWMDTRQRTGASVQCTLLTFC